MRQADGTEALSRVRAMRSGSTEAEARLWAALRGRRLEGAKFRRQVWIGRYIADFLCHEARLIVEVDGSQHANNPADVRRDAELEAQGFRVLRFWNNEVEMMPSGVLERIADALRDRMPSPSRTATPSGPLPLPGGERGR